jgi:release factor glutamine methyltransferase
MTIRTALEQGTKLLDDGAVVAPRLTAEVLLCHALRRQRSYLFAHPEQNLAEVAWIHYGRYLHERLNGKPTQYITRVQEFYGRAFRVGPEVLIPRPETEHVVETALSRAPSAGRILDIGTGSGALAVTLALESGARVWASDISFDALHVACGNARSLGAAVCFVACDLGEAFAPNSFDLIVSNPPYVPQTDFPTLQREVRDFEPPVALLGGPSGLDFYRRIVAGAPRLLASGGMLIMELGFKTSGPVQAMFSDSWNNIELIPDLAGIPRVIAARLSP